MDNGDQREIFAFCEKSGASAEVSRKDGKTRLVLASPGIGSICWELPDNQRLCALPADMQSALLRLFAHNLNTLLMLMRGNGADAIVRGKAVARAIQVFLNDLKDISEGQVQEVEFEIHTRQ